MDTVGPSKLVTKSMPKRKFKNYAMKEPNYKATKTADNPNPHNA